MSSSKVWLAGVIVPPVCLVVGAVWFMLWWRKAKRLLQLQRENDNGSLPQTTPKQRSRSDSNYESSLNRLDLSSIPLPSPFLHVASSPTPPPSPAPPSPSTASIHTSINRKGSRVLAKRKRPNSTSSRHRRAAAASEIGPPGDDMPMPASTRQVNHYGMGEWGEEEGGYEEMGGGTTDESGGSREQWGRTEFGRAVSIDEMREAVEGGASPGRQASLLRRRSITWTTQELENTVSMVERPAPSRPSLGPHNTSSGVSGKTSSESKHGSSAEGGPGGSTRNLLEHEANERYYSETTAPLRDHTNVTVVATPPDRRRSITTSAPQPVAFSSFLHSPPSTTVKPYSTTVTFSPTPILSKRNSDPNRRHSNPLDNRAFVRSSYSSADLYSLAPHSTTKLPYSRYSTISVTDHSSSFREPSSKRASLGVPVGQRGGSQTAPPSPSHSNFSTHTFGELNAPGRGVEELRDGIGRGVAIALEELRAPVRPRFSWLERADSSGTLPSVELQERLVLANPDSPTTTTRSSYEFHHSGRKVSPSIVATLSHSQNSH